MLRNEDGVEMFRRAFRELHGEGKEWVDTYKEVAPLAITYHEGYMRRRRVVNGLLRVAGINRDEAPKKAPYNFRNIVAGLALMRFREAGELDERFVDLQGQILEDTPEGKLDYRNKRHKLIEGTAVQAQPVAETV